MTTHQFKLTHGSAFLLKTILTAPEALKTLPLKMAACVLIESTLDAQPKPPEEGFDAWAKSDWQTVELTEKQRDAAKEAVKWAVENGRVPASGHLALLISQLGLDS